MDNTMPPFLELISAIQILWFPFTLCIAESIAENILDSIMVEISRTQNAQIGVARTAQKILEAALRTFLDKQVVSEILANRVFEKI